MTSTDPTFTASTFTAPTLTDLRPPTPDPDSLYEAFSGWANEQGLVLYPHQEEALIEIVSGANVILTRHQFKDPPVGSGEASFVPFTARLASPWTVLALTDGVWKYAGWDHVLQVAAQCPKVAEVRCARA